MSETIEGFWNKFRKWQEAFESKDLNVNLVIASVEIRNNSLYKTTA